MTEMTPAKYALNNIEQFRAAMDEMPDEQEKGRQAVKDLENEYIERQTAMGYDYSKKPEYYSHWDWCGQCNRSLKSWDDDVCDCVDWDEE